MRPEKRLQLLKEFHSVKANDRVEARSRRQKTADILLRSLKPTLAVIYDKPRRKRRHKHRSVAVNPIKGPYHIKRKRRGDARRKVNRVR